MTAWARPSATAARAVTQLEMMPKAPDKARGEQSVAGVAEGVYKTDYGQEEAIAVFGHDPRIYQTTVKEFVKRQERQSLRACHCKA